MQTISLLVLIVAIAIGFWKNINVGIVSLALGTFLPSCRITRPWNFFREKLSVYLKRGPFSCLS